MSHDVVSENRGKMYWRSMGEYTDTPEFRAWAQREFPELAAELDRSYAEGGTSRRKFLQLMGASIALAGLMGASGCRRKEEKIRPYNQKPAEIVPGKPLYYATTMVLAGIPIGLLAETHEGRPTKIEGNPKHPNSLGATPAYAQASVLDLYDPDRSRSYMHDGKAVTREQFLTQIDDLSKKLKEQNGEGLAFLSEDDASPAMRMLREHLGKVMPRASWHVYEPLAFGQNDWGIPDLDSCDVILSLDCDFLGWEDQGVRCKRQFASRREADQAPATMNRLYVIEPHFTTTGAAADHRLAVPASQIQAVASALVAEIDGKKAQEIPGVDPRWIVAVAKDLKEHPGRAIVLAGRRQPSRTQRLATLINQRLQAPIPRPARRTSDTQSLETLVAQMRNHKVSTLIVIGGNAAYDAPVEMNLAELIRPIATSIRLGLYEDETSEACRWHVPAAHYLETWGDAITNDGMMSPVQPMIDPLFGGMSRLELVARITGYDTSDPYEIVRRSFMRMAQSKDFEQAWRQFLHEGVCPLASSQPSAVVQDNSHASDDTMPVTGSGTPLSASNIEICFAMDESVFDGRFANNGWLQECPDPMTKIVWDNAAILSPRTAKSLDVANGQMLRIEVHGRSIEIPAFIMPGHADWSITLPLGYGRSRSGSLGTQVGTNAYALRTGDAMGFVVGAALTRMGKTYPLATTQEHWAVDLDKHFLGIGNEEAKDRALIRQGTLDEYRRDPEFARKMGEHAPTSENIYTSPQLDGAHQWGMTIDLNTCIGCSACTIACQAENNIPIVGKDEVIRGREMHWLRLDRYFSGDVAGDVSADVQPMMCQHCENAPCEPVCPVNATVHSPEGLNEMVYNRCIGTRYCSNNCPYKVRRFNFFDYNKGTLRESGKAQFDGSIQPDPRKGFSLPQLLQPPMQELLKMQKNPDVTVRMRGVMEKCTYCVQRVQAAKIEAQSTVGQGPANGNAHGRAVVKVPDGTVQTACQQACPTQAIVFGDLSDPGSRVSRIRASQRSYAVLEHLNVKPRTAYLARLRNVNPQIAMMKPQMNADEHR